MKNHLIVIENGKLQNYPLDNKLLWEIGRPSKENHPDIRMYSATVSRKHGKFVNRDGCWFYVDGYGKNGTVYNGKHIETGRSGRVKPILLSSGDIFFFGGGREAIFSPQTIWARFSTDSYSDTIQVEDTMDEDLLVFMDGEKQIRLERPEKGTVVEGESGMGIYMGDMTYLIGDMRLHRE